MRKAAVMGLVGCAGPAAGSKTQTPRLAAWFGSEATDPILLGDETDPTSPPG